ncbi:MAG: uncharacterized protein QG567_2513 [Campylobacterota bacterium]|nr:uncharacterized protein [Campylobacterota bacterium]
MVRKLFKTLIRGYQIFISPILPGKCRYYPTCSNYALIQFEKRPVFLAFFSTIFRVLRCNKLFKGGFDYPTVEFKIHKKKLIFQEKKTKKKVLYWLVPFEKNRAKIIKNFDKE